MPQVQARILLISDGNPGLLSIQAKLEKLGHECSIATSMEEAESLVQTGPVHLVLTMLGTRWLSSSFVASVLRGPAVFCCFPVETGYWWVPVSYEGDRRQFDAPAVRSPELLNLIQQAAALHALRRPPAESAAVAA